MKVDQSLTFTDKKQKNSVNKIWDKAQTSWPLAKSSIAIKHQERANLMMWN